MANLLNVPGAWSPEILLAFNPSSGQRTYWHELTNFSPGDVVAGSVIGSGDEYGNQIYLNFCLGGVVHRSVPVSIGGDFSIDAADGLIIVAAYSPDYVFPNEFYSGALTITATPVATESVCEEVGNATRINVTAYDRQREAVVRVRRGEKRCLVVNFNGAIPINRSIASVGWSNSGMSRISEAGIYGREAQISIDAQNSGSLFCIATLDNGERYTQLIRVSVYGPYWYPSDNVLTVNA